MHDIFLTEANMMLIGVMRVILLTNDKEYSVLVVDVVYSKVSCWREQTYNILSPKKWLRQLKWKHTHALSCRRCKCPLTVSIGGIFWWEECGSELERSRRKRVSSKLSGAVNVQCSVLFHQQVINCGGTADAGAGKANNWKRYDKIITGVTWM